MKYFWLLTAALCLMSTSFSDSAIAKNEMSFAVGDRQSGKNLAQNINNDPQTAEEYIQRSISYLRSQPPKVNEAIADLDRAIELNPDLYPAYLIRGQIYQQLKKPNKALADYNLAIELNPQFSEAYSQRGILYFGLQKFQKAQIDLDRAINEFQFQTGSNYLYRGISNFKLGNVAQSKQDVEQASKLFAEQGDRQREQFAKQFLYSLESDPTLNP